MTANVSLPPIRGIGVPPVSGSTAPALSERSTCSSSSPGGAWRRPSVASWMQNLTPRGKLPLSPRTFARTPTSIIPCPASSTSTKCPCLPTVSLIRALEEEPCRTPSYSRKTTATTSDAGSRRVSKEPLPEEVAMRRLSRTEERKKKAEERLRRTQANSVRMRRPRFGSLGQEEVLRHVAQQVYGRLDPEGHGVVTYEKFARQLQERDPGRWGDPESIRKLLNSIDTNGDWCIQFEEMLTWLAVCGDEWDETRSECPIFQGNISALVREEKVPVKQEPLADYYKLQEVIGSGSFGSVDTAEHLETHNIRAIKSVLKTKMERHELDAEIGIMRHLDHPNILRLYEVFEDNRFVYIVMELCAGGELFKHIVESKHFNERQAARVMQQIVGGVHYLHMNCICHRDLKPENFLLQAKGPIEECKIKIIDFGMACRFNVGTVLTERVGTPFYVAPEVLRGSYDHLCDVWSCGVIMFLMIAGYLPFYGHNIDEITASVLKGDFNFHNNAWEDVSQDAKDLVRCMLVYNAGERFSASKVASHTWLKDNAPGAKAQSLEATDAGRMAQYCGLNSFKKKAVNIIAHSLSEEMIHQLQGIFESMDVNGDGEITFQELADGVQKLDNPNLLGDLRSALEAMDIDRSGRINYTEFLAATLDASVYAEEKFCWMAFRNFDRNGDGKITKQEMIVLLQDAQVNKAMRPEVAEKIMNECDKDGDGEIGFEEFYDMMKRGA